MKIGAIVRIFIQLQVMLSDILIIGAVAFLFYVDPFNPFIWIVSALAIWAWHKQGGFMAWNLKNIRMFLKGDD